MAGRFKKNKGKRFYTCAIRPAAIYGPGEERHFPRIVSFAKLGLLPFKIGDSNVKTDWVYVDNLVLATILASMGLLDDIPNKGGHPVAAGQPYFISDGSPINSFEFLRPLLRSLDYDLPKAALSVSHALILGRMFSAIYTVLYPWLNRWWLPQPFILPAEVYKVGVTHYFSFLKAKEELGYVPMVSPREGMAATISYWQERKRRNFGWSYHICMAICGRWNDFIVQCCLLARRRTSAAYKSYIPFLLSVYVGDEGSFCFIYGSTSWRGSICMASGKKGGSCKCKSVVLADICSRVLFIAFSVEESQELKSRH
ncbi:hypothetical protein OIU77_026262 [Salix suchowensis]|uniref:3-beta hydroxysteroid dehydrogenase/isomerase domain-containing protein n=1 Tax=Salix suchowensis TaxID=1278906 RepID=A0ABQ9C3C9_9ROSI|nr:hypothetical protein OIU77_026262 [Salix suchowensis]